jgi:glucosylglycerate synthase
MTPRARRRAPNPYLDAEARLRLEEIGDADILLGIPSFNNERTVGHVVRAAEYGLAKYFPEYRAVLLNADGGSSDGTRRVVQETSVYQNLDTLLIRRPTHPTVHVAGTYTGVAGKGSAFRAIFEAAKLLDVKACVVLDSDLRSITPEWIELLAGPVLLKGYDFVTPHYARHKYDGTITNHVAYPLTRALYGKRIRQPIGGDFGLSGEFASTLPERDVWETDVARFGIDIWTTTVAINEGRRVCQGHLGAKLHQVVGTLFTLMRTYEERWRSVPGSEPTPTFGFRTEIAPVPVDVDLGAMVQSFHQGAAAYDAEWTMALDASELESVQKVLKLDPDAFRFPVDLWVRVLYSFAATHVAHPDIRVRKRLVESLVPLYFARCASYVHETATTPTAETEPLIEAQAARFEELKPFLVDRLEERRRAFAEVPAPPPEPIPTAAEPPR